MRALLACVLFASIGLVTPAQVARAQGAEPQDTMTEARSHFRLGSAYFRGGAFDLALEEFEAAYKLDPRPDMLFNLAQCQRQLGHDREALALYRAFLRELPGSPRRAEVQSYVDELTKKLATPEPKKSTEETPEKAAPITKEPAPAEPKVDNEPAAPAAPNLPMPAPGAPERSRGATLKQAGLGLGIAGLLVAAGGAGLLGAAAADNDSLNHPQPGAVYPASLEDRMWLLRDTGAAALGVGLAAGVTGAILYVVGVKRPPALSVTSRGATLKLAWEF